MFIVFHVLRNGYVNVKFLYIFLYILIMFSVMLFFFFVYIQLYTLIKYTIYNT